MNPSGSKDQRPSNKTPSKPYASSHRKAIKDLLIAMQKQQDIMAQLTKDLTLFRDILKMSLDYDNGTGDYIEDSRDGPIDLRSYMEVGNGMISTKTAVNYMGYRSAMHNFQVGFGKTKDEAEKIWEAVDVVQDVEIDSGVQKDQLVIPEWFADVLEQGRKTAVQELQCKSEHSLRKECFVTTTLS